MKFLLIVLILLIAVWILVDALYWGLSDFPALFPHSRYFELVAIVIAIAVVLWVVIYAVGRIVLKKRN